MTQTMTERSARHASFVIERRYNFPPSRVFAAWAENKAKDHWFVGPADWTLVRRELDFRVGGKERVIGRFPNGRTTDFDAHYDDIVTDRRLIYTYTMRLNDEPISVSLATVEFRAAGKGTLLVFTEQAVFIDGYDDPGAKSREEGTRTHIERIDEYLQGKPATR